MPNPDELVKHGDEYPPKGTYTLDELRAERERAAADRADAIQKFVSEIPQRSYEDTLRESIEALRRVS